MTAATVTVRRFARITAQLMRALIMAAVAVVLGYLLIHPHARPAPPHSPASQAPTVAVIAPQRPGVVNNPTD
ncbi:hypothetical protein [Nocardia alni]|uniref:hypothetical protein n=1 Tax=Nocardia alni TaxID=2815723 RepID=UPI001C23BE9C|nr:hypothetical protein [Nocardia alni]